MENLTIVGTEDGLLVLATESGERFALPIDELLHSELRRARRRQTSSATRMAASPRDIQAHIRSGLTAAEVAEALGVDIDDVARFEGPVLAEREHVVGQALAVPVLIGSEVEPDAQPTFGAAIGAKLAEAGATAERWASWKEESGWIVKVEFTANEVEHDARWSFDPRASALAPLNADAVQLSRQGSLPEGLIPRLRAVEGERTESPYKDDSRFDSGAFGPRLLPAADTASEAGSSSSDETAATPPAGDSGEGRSSERGSSAAQDAATRSAPDQTVTRAETADLLEALRRRRGQREGAPAGESDTAPPTPELSPIALFDAPEPETPAPDPAPDAERDAPASEGMNRRRRRGAMPSWDEIVFGARTDD